MITWFQRLMRREGDGCRSVSSTRSEAPRVSKNEIAKPPERPIETQQDDVLDRSPFVRRLCRALIDEESRKATGVTIGLVAPWGSGKSSLLNLLQEALKKQAPDTLVVRFDPWLISGRDSLIAQFMKELATNIGARPNLRDRATKVIGRLMRYAADVAPIADSVIPGAGSVSSKSLKRGASWADPDEVSLHERRKQVSNLLEELSVPIVCLIDEIDRLDDQEIRTITQLVRAVADFPSISYVLAYDSERVVKALGGDNEEFGQSYLEKIVQHQIHLPIILPDELKRLLVSEIGSLNINEILSSKWEEDERFLNLIDECVPRLIATPRDIKRLVGTFHVLVQLVQGEVTWQDTLGFSVLQVKAPKAVDSIRRNPERFVSNALDPGEAVFRFGSGARSNEEIFEHALEASKDDVAVSNAMGLLQILFPNLLSDGRTNERHSDALCWRRALFTILRLGLLPGTFTRNQIVDLLNLDRESVAKTLSSAFENGTLPDLMDRLDDVYGAASSWDDKSLWEGIAEFLKKSKVDWEREYSGRHEYVREFAALMERKVRRQPDFKGRAARIFELLLDQGEVTLTSMLLRGQLFNYGLFGREKRSDRSEFLSKISTKNLAASQSDIYRERHLSSDWFLSLTDLQPLYTMIDTGRWDDECRSRLQQMVERDDAFGAIALMLFGGIYSTDKETVDSIIGFDWFKKMCGDVIEDKERTIALSDSAMLAIRKFCGENC